MIGHTWIAVGGPAAGVLAQRLEGLDSRLQRLAERQHEVQGEISAGRAAPADPAYLRAALEAFDPIKLDRTYVSGVERGVRNPTIMTLLRICKALGTTPATILRSAEQKQARGNRS